MNRPTALLIPTLALLMCGCTPSPYAGNWAGVRKPSALKLKAKAVGYSESKPSLNSSLELGGDGSYTAKFEEVDYTGTWTAQGQKIVLKPKTYMGVELATFPKTKQPTSAQTINDLFAPYELEASADGQSLTHTDKFGVVTYKKSG